MERRVRKWLQALRQEGYEAYLVGGAVRDMLLHRKPHDYDIVTQARPEEIKQVAQRHGWSCTMQPGEVFGIVTVRVEGLSLETATYRKEVYGKDSHRPSDIWYATTLQEDMLRRDFTINALAMTAEGRILDYVGGQRDLKEKKVSYRRGAGAAFSRRWVAVISGVSTGRSVGIYAGGVSGTSYAAGVVPRCRYIAATGGARRGPLIVDSLCGRGIAAMEANGIGRRRVSQSEKRCRSSGSYFSGTCVLGFAG